MPCNFMSCNYMSGVFSKPPQRSYHYGSVAVSVFVGGGDWRSRLNVNTSSKPDGWCVCEPGDNGRHQQAMRRSVVMHRCCSSDGCSEVAAKYEYRIKHVTKNNKKRITHKNG